MPMPAPSALLLCVVVGITDGDTLTARCAAVGDAPAQTLKVRLAEVDAPEHGQPFGGRAKQALAALCFDRRAQVRPIPVNGGLDRYGRTVAHVSCNGVNANTEQVRSGMAWVFERYVTDRSLYRLQGDARTAHRGLWADSQPVPPWEWRRRAH